MADETDIRFVRVAFVVVKLRAGEESFYLLRYNPKWNDLNLIGGHEDTKDGGIIERTARRELREEVPLIRTFEEYRLSALSEPVIYGPVMSKSKNVVTRYEVHFYLLKLDSSPAPLVHLLTSRSKNVWIDQRNLESKRYRISSYIELLNNSVVGGLRAIPYSSNTNMISIRNHFDGQIGDQMRFHFK